MHGAGYTQIVYMSMNIRTNLIYITTNLIRITSNPICITTIWSSKSPQIHGAMELNIITNLIRVYQCRH